MLPNPGESLVTRPGKSVIQSDSHLTEPRLVFYLSKCFRKCASVSGRKSSSLSLRGHIKTMRSMIVQNLVTAFREPELYSGQELGQQLAELIQDSGCEVEEWLLQLLTLFTEKAREEEAESGLTLESIFGPILDRFKTGIQDVSMLFFSVNNIVPLQYFVKV